MKPCKDGRHRWVNACDESGYLYCEGCDEIKNPAPFARLRAIERKGQPPSSVPQTKLFQTR